MSRTILFVAGYLFALLLMCAACSKGTGAVCDDLWTNTGDSTSVTGTWELSAGFNGWGGIQYYRPCNGRRLKFTDSTFEMYADGQMFRQGRYYIFRDSFPVLGGVQNRIIFDHDTDIRQAIRNTGSRLYLNIDGNDAPGAEYSRMR